MIDGIFLVYCLRLIGIRCERRSFDMTSLAPILFKACESNGKSVYFLGSKQEEVKISVQNIQVEFPKLHIAGWNDGYINDQDVTRIGELLTENKVDYLIIGMGTPLQEKRAIQFKELGFQGTVYTCGGFLHQSIDNLIYYPEWINKLNLRWIFRIYDQPELFKRYFLYYPFFIIVFIADTLRYIFKLNK
jgi:exopolysaccharide biosynthesis WecB/TagA/CpsF family protein